MPTPSLALDKSQQFELLLENVVDYALIVMDKNGIIATWGVGAQKIMGYTEEETIGQHARLIFTDIDAENKAPEMELRTAETMGRAEDIRWHRKKDGSLFWGDGIVTPLHDEEGILHGFVKIFRDRTHEREIENALSVEYKREKRIAQALQKALLIAPSMDNLRGLDVEAFYKPASDEAMVGGDFYDAFPLDGGRIAIVVGDASGKGIDAAARTVEVKYAARAYLDEYRHPARALTQINRFICEKQQYNLEDPDSFVCVLLMIIDPVSGEVLVASAGAEPPLLVRAKANNAGIVGEQIATSGMPLGIMPDVDYQMVKVQLMPRDVLLITTDGITEARRGRELLGPEGLLESAESSYSGRMFGSDPNLEALGAAIVRNAEEFSGGSFRDDVCMLLARLK